MIGIKMQFEYFYHHSKSNEMKYLKWPLIILGSLLAIYLLLCFIGPKNMNTSRSTKITASSAQIFNLFDDLKMWESWSPWAKMDTTQKLTFGEKTVGKGASYSWKGEATGSGDLEIIESTTNAQSKIKMNFHDYESSTMVDFKIENLGEEQELTWSMVDEVDLPFLARGAVLLKGEKSSLQNNFEDGLLNIKTIAEQRAAGNYNGHAVALVNVDEKHFVVNRQEIPMASMEKFLASNYVKLMDEVSKAGIEMAGSPSGLYYKWNEGESKTDMAAAIPIAEATAFKNMSSVSLPASKAIQVDYYGDSANSASAHYAIDAYMKDHGIVNNVPILEEYITDPTTEPDPSKWLTKIIYYIAE